MMKAEPVSLVMIGVGGMGAVYLQALLERQDEGLFRITGAVDPQPNRCKQYVEMRAMGVPCFISLQDFYRNRKADLAILSSPIQIHMPQTTFALGKGSHVLCEKPAAGTIQEVRAAAEAERASGRWVAVGYQWSFSPAVQALKADIRSGLFGAPRKFKCLYLWPRDEGYYARNDWAGRKRDAEGAWVLDSPVQNAMAHDLHNMFYILGRETETSARPAAVEAELYRANAIENFDTAAARIRTDEGVEILFYGVPDDEPMNKLWQSIAGAREGGARPLCGLEAAASQTLCVNGVQDSMPDIRDFPAGLVRTVDGLAAPRSVVETPGAKRRVVEGLDEALAACYEAEKLPSEMGLPWSAKGAVIDLTEYAAYPSR
jgi:predicted dehydrogenase